LTFNRPAERAPARRPIDPGQLINQRRIPRAAGAYDGNEFTGLTFSDASRKMRKTPAPVSYSLIRCSISMIFAVISSHFRV
jgi:hypothetical protein